jgi:integrase
MKQSENESHQNEFASSGTSPTTSAVEHHTVSTSEPIGSRAILSAPPIRTTQRKRGKSMSRRKGQNPKLRVVTRSNGSQYFYFQYWLDVAGVDERSRRREIVGPVKTKSGGLTRTEAEAKKMKFLAELNSRFFAPPSSKTFADAVKHYREVFAPRMLRDSTFSTADSHLKNHLEPDWRDVPIDHITIDTINDWAWKKKREGLSWVTIKNVLRTMQRVLSASSKSKTVPFSQDGLAIPERDKLQMKINSRKHVSYSWEQTLRIVEQVQQLENLGEARQEQYTTLFLLAAASGLRISELLALRSDDIDFDSSTVRVDESVDRLGQVGPCKNVSAYRTVVLVDVEGKHAMQKLKQFVTQDGLIFRSRSGGPLVENTILVQGLHPALKKLGFLQAGMHAFRRGCNRRWELARVSAAVIRQQMGHASASMTAHYTGEIPVEVVKNFLQLDSNGAAIAA